MIRSLVKYSCLVIASVNYVAAQDSGEGFVFKCDQPGSFALTFDDGPSPYTGTLLATLKSYGIKATFFSVGTQAADASISKYLKQAYAEGHQIASHTNTHADLNKLTADQVRNEMKLTENAIRSATGVVPAMMRPPYGNCNEQCRGIMKEMGYTVVQWSVDSNDWQYMQQPEKWDSLVTNVVKVVDASNIQTDSFVSLQHDIHNFSVERTPKVIDSIKAKGYKFVTVSECLSNRFPMYQNQANPSPSAPISTPTASANSTLIVSPTGSATSVSASASVTGSLPLTTSASSISSISTSTSTVSITDNSSQNPTTTKSQNPPTDINTGNDSAVLSASTFTMSIIALCLGYHNQN
ncbi:hypothetical protein K7432_008620 [Basidiobolus ranarum]|uniref:NodB homology domain-containing protein n=1 Tax=Basidiobolus ranarum TaxID=34480 RepID=A0ABR2VY97_9FUNG